MTSSEQGIGESEGDEQDRSVSGPNRSRGQNHGGVPTVVQESEKKTCFGKA